ncbi:NAD(P)-dependent oxidoreductase [Desulfosediminicola flagellatus]|uniref:NAD(P)-dependent oxidoreductase n=1 Tax=Desulfosediminicola flagellatus TaxID=2569541 RepID=UPI0010AD2A3D|nr:NAD(P)-dependent oxidoreductase [Desulfosediminicola flagellatus]
MTKYGFLGIGIMGKAMVANLLQAGLDVTVWNRTASRCDSLIDMGASHADSPAAVIEKCDITFAMVSDPEAAEALCFGEHGVLAGMSAGKSYVDVSTVAPETSQKISAAIKEKGGMFLEAPVSGSKKPAEDGTLVFLCSGDEALYTLAKPALDIMGKKSYYFSETGQGAQMKLVINMVMGTMMTAFAEGLALGDKIGLKMEDVIDVLAQGAINNPMFQLKGPLMADGKFAPAFPLKHMQKDMRLALQLGDKHSQPMYTAAAANNSYIKARDNGSEDEDFSAVMKVI